MQIEDCFLHPFISLSHTEETQRTTEFNVYTFLFSLYLLQFYSVKLCGSL